MSGTNGVTWKWMVGIMATIILGGGAGWMTTMWAEVSGVKEDQKHDRESINQIERKVDVIEERTRRSEEDMKELKEDQKDMKRAVDEILRLQRKQ